MSIILYYPGLCTFWSFDFYLIIERNENGSILFLFKKRKNVEMDFFVFLFMGKTLDYFSHFLSKKKSNDQKVHILIIHIVFFFRFLFFYLICHSLINF